MPTLNITDCRECPKSTESKIYTADSWDNVQGVYRTLKKSNPAKFDPYEAAGGNKYSGNYEPFDKHKIMPKWCPLEKK